MDTIEEYYFELGIKTEAQNCKKFYLQSVTKGMWIDTKVAIINYEEVVENAKRYLGENSELVQKLKSKLNKMDVKPFEIL